MADLPIVVLVGPAADDLSFDALRRWLRRSKAELRQLIDDGIIMDGKARLGRSNKTWTRLEAAIAKWELDNHDRYNRRPIRDVPGS